MAVVMGFLAAVDPHPCVAVTGGVESRRPSLRSSFVGAWRCRKSVSSLRRRRQGRSRRLVIVSELAGQYDENFEDVHSEGRSTLRPADVLVYGWIGGKHACVDLTGVSPLVGLGGGAFTVGQTAIKAASAKVAKHEKACTDNQHVFIPFAFDTFGFLAPDAVEFLKRVQKVMHNNVMTPRSMDVVFKRIGFAIQKGLAAQLVARLPLIPM